MTYKFYSYHKITSGSDQHSVHYNSMQAPAVWTLCTVCTERWKSTRCSHHQASCDVKCFEASWWVQMAAWQLRGHQNCNATHRTQ